MDSPPAEPEDPFSFADDVTPEQPVSAELETPLTFPETKEKTEENPEEVKEYPPEDEQKDPLPEV